MMDLTALFKSRFHQGNTKVRTLTISQWKKSTCIIHSVLYIIKDNTERGTERERESFEKKARPTDKNN